MSCSKAAKARPQRNGVAEREKKQRERLDNTCVARLGRRGVGPKTAPAPDRRIEEGTDAFANLLSVSPTEKCRDGTNREMPRKCGEGKGEGSGVLTISVATVVPLWRHLSTTAQVAWVHGLSCSVVQTVANAKSLLFDHFTPVAQWSLARMSATTASGLPWSRRDKH